MLVVMTEAGAEPRVEVNLPCIGCGYNLRMQRVDGVCPECQGSVAESREKSITRWGEKYLRRLGRSAAWMAGTRWHFR